MYKVIFLCYIINLTGIQNGETLGGNDSVVIILCYRVYGRRIRTQKCECSSAMTLYWMTGWLSKCLTDRLDECVDGG